MGVLYHVPHVLPDLENPSYLNPCHLSRKKSRKLTKDPFRPKSNRSGYNFFFAEQYAKLKPSHSGEESAITKQIGQLWNQLNTTEKEVSYELHHYIIGFLVQFSIHQRLWTLKFDIVLSRSQGWRMDESLL